jgi:hypothetical protein
VQCHATNGGGNTPTVRNSELMRRAPGKGRHQRSRAGIEAPRWVVDTPGPLVLAKHPPFNHLSDDLLKACEGRNKLFVV